MSEVWLRLERIKCYQTDEYGDDEIYIKADVAGSGSVTVWGPRDMNEGTNYKTDIYIGKDVRIIPADTGHLMNPISKIEVWEYDPESPDEKFGEIPLNYPPRPPSPAYLQSTTIRSGDAHYDLTYSTYWE
jgi:hypothetical protein